MHCKPALLLASFLISMPFLGVMRGQDYRAKIQGDVTDPSQAAIVGAKVTLTNVNTGISATRETGTNGRYIFDFVEPGTYTVTVEQTGFNKFAQGNVQVQVRGDVTVNAVLTLGSVSQQVKVGEVAPGVQFNTSTMENTVDRKMLTELPVLARNPFTLALLNPAVVNRYWADRNPFFMWSSSSIDVGGSTSGKNDLLLDGAPLMMSIKGSYAPSMDAVQEFSVQQNSVDAEFGYSAGGTLSLSMRSGTNDFHGTAYYFGRNPVFNAVSNAVTHAPNQVRNHIWGATLGNPIKKNKLFTFTAWEQWRKREPRTNFMTMPTDLERTGDFSKSLNAKGGLRTIYDPWTTRLDPNTNQYVRTPFPGNIIPQNRLDLTALIFMQDIWKPNNPGDDITGVNNWKETWIFNLKYWNFSNRTDWNISDKWRIFGRFSQFHNTIEELHSVKSRALTGWDGGTMYALNADGESVYVISPTTVFNVGGSYGSIHDDYYAPNVEIHSGDLASFWPSGWYTPYIKDLPQIYYPALNIGDASIGHGFYWIEHPKNASFRAKLSHIQRKHEMKFGLQYRRQFGLIQYPDLADFNFGPELTADTFVQPNTLLSGSPWATFLLGALDGSSSSQYVAPRRLVVNSYAPFFHDDIKMASRLTVNLGLRYEYETAPKDGADRISRYLDLTNPVPEMQSNPPVLPAEVLALRQSPPVYNGAWIFSDSSHRSMFRTSKRSLEPRLGLAFRATDKTALRVGFARYITPVAMAQAFETQDPPFYGYTAQTYTAPLVEGIPVTQLGDPFNSKNPIILPLQKSLGRYQNLGDKAAWDAQDFNTVASYRINFTVQQQIPGNTMLEATWFVNRSSNVPYSKPLNMVDPNLTYTYKGALDRSVANPFYNYLTPDKFPGPLRYRQAVSVGNLLRPYPQYLDLTQLLTARRDDHYEALQLRVQRQFSKGLSLLWTYSYNREQTGEFFNDLDLFADKTTFIDSNNPRHRMNFAGTYDLPFGKSRRFLSNANAIVNGIFGGWSFSWIFMYNSGEFIRFGQMIVNGNPAISNPTRSRYFDTSVFAPPQPYTPRTNPWQFPGVTGPRFANMDSTLAKYFPLGERFHAELRVEAYNLTNSFMASNPNNDVYSSLFGRSTGQANRGREMQYTFRLHF